MQVLNHFSLTMLQELRAGISGMQPDNAGRISEGMPGAHARVLTVEKVKALAMLDAAIARRSVPITEVPR